MQIAYFLIFFVCFPQKSEGGQINKFRVTTECRNPESIRGSQMCYFDITHDGSEEGTRLYVSEDAGCSNSSEMSVGKVFSGKFQYVVFSKALSGMKEGPHVFHFAETKKYEASYYGLDQRNKLNKRYQANNCQTPQYVKDTYSNNMTIKIINLSKVFQGCMDFNFNYKKLDMGKFIKCRIVKTLQCGSRMYHHEDPNDITCNWVFDAEKVQFNITVQNLKNVST